MGTARHSLTTTGDFLRWYVRTSKRINVNDEHWLWLGGKDRDGYGIVGVPQPGGTYKTVRAHRWFYEFFEDNLPPNFDVEHKENCQVRLCVNPDHLRAVKHGQRTSEYWARKRTTATR